MLWVQGWWLAVENAIAVHILAPFFGLLHLTNLTDDPHLIARVMMVSLLQIGVVGLVFRPLELLFPLEKSVPAAVAIDRNYTLLKLLFLAPLFNYVILVPLSNLIDGGVETHGFFELDQLFPWLQAHQVLQFFIYFAIYDFTLYVIHRLQHSVPAWWMLHSLHHSQRHLNCWSNDRDSFLDDVFEAVIFAFVAMLVGASPTEYAGVLLFGQLLENFSHTNIRFGWGKVLNKFFVGPDYHRLHHMRDDPAFPNRHNCNFSFIFPIWDILFGTALYNEPTHSCGVSDSMIDADNELSLWVQQWAAVRRFWNRLMPAKA